MLLIENICWDQLVANFRTTLVLTKKKATAIEKPKAVLSKYFMDTVTYKCSLQKLSLLDLNLHFQINSQVKHKLQTTNKRNGKISIKIKIKKVILYKKLVKSYCKNLYFSRMVILEQQK